MPDDRDTLKLMSGPEVTVVRRWTPEDEDLFIRSEKAEEILILPLAHGAVAILKVGEVAIRVTMTREELFFHLGALVGVADDPISAWMDREDEHV